MSRRIRLALLLSALALASGGGEAHAAKIKPPARAKVPAVRPRAPQAGALGLRAAPLALVPAPPALVWSDSPAPALRRLGQGTALASGGLVGLRAQTDPAPLCRTQCATVRYQCLAADQPEACDGNWTRCVLSCREPLQP